ncbi:glycosyltransferase family 2 protein [Raineyella antarctica]|uniref:glycosyltransferase family 2 protein n=1 Tax=Raineyella antarctica TaxID=1577474 RepID=UPI0015881675|nr:glycosyltransferase family A protein [Raineyella antarctica]
MESVEKSTLGSAPVTVVIPLYNGARFIEETLTSIERQTLPPQQVIVVDDGSTDGGPDLVLSHPLGATLLEQSHLGVAVARNNGLAATRTPWVAFLDQDDLWHPERVARLIAWVVEHPEDKIVATSEIAFSAVEEVNSLAAQDELVGAWASVVVPENGAYERLCREADVTGSEEVTHADHRDMLRGPITVTTSLLADAHTLRLAGGFAPHALAMDDYWLLVNAARLHPIAKIDQPTIFYRVHAGATSRTTRLALPFLSSAVALRYGGGMAAAEEALARESTGPLHDHLFTELVRSAGFKDPRVRSAARDLAGLLWQDGKRAELRKDSIRRRASWLVPIVRGLRSRVDQRARV